MSPSPSPAGRIEEFFRRVENFPDLPTAEQVRGDTVTDEQVTALRGLFDEYGMDLLGPGLLID